MSAEKLIRYRATVRTDPEGGYQFRGKTLHASRDRAIKEAVDKILEDGVVEIEEVPVRKRQRTEYEEVE